MPKRIPINLNYASILHLINYANKLYKGHNFTVCPSLYHHRVVCADSIHLQKSDLLETLLLVPLPLGARVLMLVVWSVPLLMAVI